MTTPQKFVDEIRDTHLHNEMGTCDNCSKWAHSLFAEDGGSELCSKCFVENIYYWEARGNGLTETVDAFLNHPDDDVLKAFMVEVKNILTEWGNK